MGKRSAEVELFLGNMGSIQRETRPSMQREESAGHGNGTRTNSSRKLDVNRNSVSRRWLITSRSERVWESLIQIPEASAAGVDGQTVEEAKKSFEEWIGPCSNPFTVKDIERRIYGGSISRSPASRKSAHSGCPLSPTGHSSAARPKCCRPSMSRTFCPAHSAVGRRGAHHALATLNESDRRRQNRVGAGGGPEEFLRELKS